MGIVGGSSYFSTASDASAETEDLISSGEHQEQTVSYIETLTNTNVSLCTEGIGMAPPSATGNRYVYN